MSIIDKMLSEAAVAENSNAASEVSTEDNANVDCSTFEKTQSQVFGNSFSIVFMGIYAEEKDVSMLRPDIEFVLKKMKRIGDYCGLRSSEAVCFIDTKYEDTVSGIPNTYITYDYDTEMITFMICFESLDTTNIKRYIRMFAAMNKLMTDFKQRDTSFFQNELILAALQHSPVNADDKFRHTNFSRSELAQLCYEVYNPNTLLFTIDSIDDGSKNQSESTKKLCEYLTRVYMLKYNDSREDYKQLQNEMYQTIQATVSEIHQERNRLKA